ncbi:Mo-dependent nitrogenase C-terminal domain-containing protein [Anabaena azotica]
MRFHILIQQRQIFNHAIAHIPPLCKLNPLYEQLMGWRFRAQCYLAQ